MPPIYDYEHIEEKFISECPEGAAFEWEQPSGDFPLNRCPYCGQPVERKVALAAVKTKKFNCELRDMGFTKLVRVDDGVFENVTRRGDEDRYVNRRRPETFPTLEKTVKD